MMAFELNQLTDTWEEFAWPSWVPGEIRTQIQEFWAERYGRSPREWAQHAHWNRYPLFADRCIAFVIRNDQPIHGRYVHCWNNIGRLVDAHGHWHAVYEARSLDEGMPFQES